MRNLLAAPVDIICKIKLASFWIVLHLNLSNVPSWVLLPFLTSGPDLGAWPDCWVSTEFLRTPIPRKLSGSTITRYETKIRNIKSSYHCFCMVTLNVKHSETRYVTRQTSFPRFSQRNWHFPPCPL